MKRSRVKNIVKTSGISADKATYKKQRNLVVKLNKKTKNFFLKSK